MVILELRFSSQLVLNVPSLCYYFDRRIIHEEFYNLSSYFDYFFYSDIRFLPKLKLQNDERMMEIEKESCEETPTIPTGKFSVLVGEFPQSTIKGYKCQREGVAEVTKAQTVIISYFIHNLKDKILIITTSYPKDNVLQKVKVENFIKSLRIWQ